LFHVDNTSRTSSHYSSDDYDNFDHDFESNNFRNRFRNFYEQSQQNNFRHSSDWRNGFNYNSNYYSSYDPEDERNESFREIFQDYKYHIYVFLIFIGLYFISTINTDDLLGYRYSKLDNLKPVRSWIGNGKGFLEIFLKFIVFKM
jgi:hypothetical protein